MADHGRDLRRTVDVVTDVAGHAVAKVDGLADVDDLPLLVLPQIDPGLTGQVLYFLRTASLTAMTYLPSPFSMKALVRSKTGFKNRPV